MRNILVFLAALLMVFSLGCARKKTTVVDTYADSGPQTMSLDYRDFGKAADDSIQDLISSGVLDRPGGGRYVLAISDIINDTMQRIDTSQLVKKIRVALLRSGKVVTTTAVKAGGAEDKMPMQTRELRNNDEFDQGTVPGKGQMIAPDFSLSGKIVQRNVRMDDDVEQVEYYFMLSLTDVRTGLAYWENETPIIKRGDPDSVSW